MRIHSAISIALAIVFLASGCTAAPVTPREPDTYEGCGTDENWRTFDEQQHAGSVKTDDAQAPRFQSPFTDGAQVAFSDKPTFQWQPTASLTGKMNGTASCPTVCTLCQGGTPCTLCGEHDPPVSGDVYDLQFSVGGSVVYRVVTTVQFFTPSDAAWSSWKGQRVSLAITRVHLKSNGIDDDGPWRGTKPLTFTVGS